MNALTACFIPCCDRKDASGQTESAPYNWPGEALERIKVVFFVMLLMRILI